MSKVNELEWTIHSVKQKKNPMLMILLSVLFLLYPFIAAILALSQLAYRINRKWNLIIVGMFGAILGYTYLPNSTMDLTRHYIWFLQYGQADYKEFLLLMVNTTDYLSCVTYFLIGKITDNYQIIGAVSGFVFYYFSMAALDVWSDLWGIHNRPFLYIVCVMCFLALTSVYLFSTVRNGNAVAIFIYLLACQLRSYSKRRQWLFAIPCLLHFSLIPIVALYFVSIQCSRKVIRRTAIIMACSVLLFEPLLLYLANDLNVFGIGLSKKIHLYLDGEQEGALLYIGSRLRFFITCGLTFVMFISLFLINKRKITQGNPSLTKFYAFNTLFIGYVIMTSATYILARNIYMIVYLIIFYFTLLAVSRSVTPQIKNAITMLLIMVSLSGILSYTSAKEYRVVNSEIWKPNLISILSVKTDIKGYDD